MAPWLLLERLWPGGANTRAALFMELILLILVAAFVLGALGV